MMRIILIILVTISFSALAQKKVVFKYKKYQYFDFEDLNVEGSLKSPGDLSVRNLKSRVHRNKLPERKNFNKEMSLAVDGIR